MGLLLAGMDTTSQCLTHILLRLKRNPELLANLQKEIDEKLPDLTNSAQSFTSLLTTEKLDDLDQVQYFLKECLRFQTPVFETLPYMALEEIRFENGITIPKNVEFVFCP